MKTERIIQCVDTHSCGEPTRVVTGGFPQIHGETIKGKYSYMKENYDHLRRALFQEPRGFANMLGCIITEPTNSEADVGTIYTSATQYFEMCGDSTFSLTKTLIEMGIVSSKEPVTRVKLDTYGGIVNVEAQVEDGYVGEITYRSVPSFHFATEKVELPEIGSFSTELGFGGLWYAFIPASEVGYEIEPNSMSQALDLGMKILNQINDHVDVRHPKNPELDSIELITFYEKDPSPGVDYKIVNIYGDNATCRSPAGTQSAARAAVSYSKGELSQGEEIVIENGWIGSQHKVTVNEKADIDGVEGIVPELTATAYINGLHQVIFDEQDPHKEGFLL